MQETKWLSAGSIKAAADHEYGHQLVDLLRISRDPVINDLYANFKDINDLGEYAMSNIDEFIAEGWAEFRNSPSPRPLSAKIGNIILNKYKELK